MTDTNPTLAEQIETLQRIIGRSNGIQALVFGVFVNTELLTAILASLKELAALRLELAQLNGEIPYGN